MTIQEAIGVNVDIDVKTGVRLSHSEIYGRAIEFLGGLDAVAPYIPYPLDAIKKALAHDPNLNSLNLHEWELAGGFRCEFGDCMPLRGRGLWRLYSKHGITSVACKDGVCILKEAATRLANGGK